MASSKNLIQPHNSTSNSRFWTICFLSRSSEVSLTFLKPSSRYSDFRFFCKRGSELASPPPPLCLFEPLSGVLYFVVTFALMLHVFCWNFLYCLLCFGNNYHHCNCDMFLPLLFHSKQYIWKCFYFNFIQVFKFSRPS